MEKKENPIIAHLGVSGILTIVFIILKLFKVINWNWLWILSPLWIPIGIVIILHILKVLLDMMTLTRKIKGLKRKEIMYNF